MYIILSNLLFLYSAHRDHIKCKRLVNTLLHYITLHYTPDGVFVTTRRQMTSPSQAELVCIHRGHTYVIYCLSCVICVALVSSSLDNGDDCQWADLWHSHNVRLHVVQHCEHLLVYTTSVIAPTDTCTRSFVEIAIRKAISSKL